MVVAVAAACGGPILANPPVEHHAADPTPAPTTRPADPVRVELSRDDGPHDRLTEWWYYTGHLQIPGGERRFGFELVVFRAERGDLAVSWASHLALTDETGGRFHYAQRSEIGPGVDRSPRDAAGYPTGFSLAVTGPEPAAAVTSPGMPWTVSGTDGRDRLTAVASGGEVAGDPVASFGIDLELVEQKPPVLHDRDGWVDFGPAGGSYYYSRTSMTATGAVTLDGQVLDVTGTGWFDHQWGDFISVGGGGWDWFAVELRDGTELMLSLVRAPDGSHPIAYGTLVSPDGTARHLDQAAFEVEVTDDWTSQVTGATWPAGWTIRVPGEALEVHLRPTVAHQELDTRATTGVVYWEGSQHVVATRGGVPLEGDAYVELTGYDGGG
jgi:predicted secreted hydrolase